MTETLTAWAGETAANPDEYWERDGGMSTLDNRTWIWGDSPRVLASNHATSVGMTWGSTWALDGVEQGQYTGIVRASDTDLRWPNGVVMFEGYPLVTFVRVNPSDSYNVVGWGYSYNGSVTLSTETGGIGNWSSPRIVNGEVWVQRQTQYPECLIKTRKLTDSPGAEVTFSAMPPWGLEMNTQWGTEQALAVRNAEPTFEVYRTFDRVKWDLVASVTVEVDSRNPWPHVTSYGLLLTWWDGSLSHQVQRSIALPNIPFPIKGGLAARAYVGKCSSPAYKAGRPTAPVGVG